MWEFRRLLVSVWTAWEVSCKRSENQLASEASGITIPLLCITCLNTPMGRAQRCCWSGSSLMIYCVCFCVCGGEIERGLCAEGMSLCRKIKCLCTPETSTLPTLHNLVSGPPLINFTAAFPQSLWSDACEVDSPAPATATMAGKYVLDNTASRQQTHGVACKYISDGVFALFLF